MLVKLKNSASIIDCLMAEKQDLLPLTFRRKRWGCGEWGREGVESILPQLLKYLPTISSQLSPILFEPSITGSNQLLP